MKKEDQRAERASAEVVAEVLDGVLRWRDGPEAAPSTHDYDILQADGRVVAAEVTTVTLPADRALESELERNFRTPLPGLRGRCQVFVDGRRTLKQQPRAYVEELRVRLERLLQCFEAGRPSLDELEGLDRRWPDPWTRIPQYQQLHDEHANTPVARNPWPQRASEKFECSEDAVEALIEMSRARVLAVLPLVGEPRQGEANVVVRDSFRAGHVSSDDLSEAVEREAKKHDNRRKLAAADADEHHLIVLFDPMSLKGWLLIHDKASLADRGYPRPLDLPKEVDTVWAVLLSDPPVVWRYKRDDPAWQLSRPAIRPPPPAGQPLSRTVPRAAPTAPPAARAQGSGSMA